jgi:hypothetical protein
LVLRHEFVVLGDCDGGRGDEDGVDILGGRQRRSGQTTESTGGPN